jgi:hypothetical protein
MPALPLSASGSVRIGHAPSASDAGRALDECLVRRAAGLNLLWHGARQLISDRQRGGLAIF